MRKLVLTVAALPLMAACSSSGSGSSTSPGQDASEDATGNMVTGEMDTGVDSTVDVAEAAANESGPAEASVDGAMEGGVEGGSDSGLDARGDAGVDAGLDAGLDATVDATPDSSTGLDAAVDAGVDAKSCSVGQSLCDGGCLPTTSDDSNCGGCGVSCGSGQTCVSSSCVTPVSSDAGTACDPSARAAAGVVTTSSGVYLVEGIPTNTPSPLSTTELFNLVDGGVSATNCTLPSSVTVPIAEYGMGTTIAAGSAYLVGGYTTVSQANVYRAAMDDAGVLGAFSTALLADGGASVVLGTSRYHAALVRAGVYVYVIGGFSGAPPSGTDLADIERAQIDPATGDFVTNFAPAPATDGGASPTLAVPLGAATVFQQGSWVYLLGGQTQHGSNVLWNSIQRASIDANGNLSSFTLVGSLPTSLSGATPYVAGGTFYLLGGGTAISGGSYTVTNGILQADIASDGTLGTFTTSAVTLGSPVMGANAAYLGSTVYLIEGLGSDGVNATTQIQSFHVP